MAVVQGSNAFLPGEIPRRKCRGKSAEAIVARRETGGWKMPAETVKPENCCREGLNWLATVRPRGGGAPDDPVWGRHRLLLATMGSMGRSGRTLWSSLYGRGNPSSDRNRPVRTRTPGGVGPVAG